MKNPHKALLEKMVSIILKTPWDVVDSGEVVGMGFDSVVCPFCGLTEMANPKEGEDKPGPYTPYRPEQLDVQKKLENPDNHAKDCLWRLAKEYRW